MAVGLNEATRALERGEGLALLLLCRCGSGLAVCVVLKCMDLLLYVERSHQISHRINNPPTTHQQTHPNPHSDVKPLALLEPPATLCHLRRTSFFVLPKATAALGAALGLKRVAALGFRKRPLVVNGKEVGDALGANADAGVKGGGNGGDGGDGGGEGLEEVRARIASCLKFVLAKREFMTNPPPLLPMAPEEEG